MKYQKIIQPASICVAGFLFLVEVLPFVTGYDNLPDLIEVVSGDGADVEKNATQTTNNSENKTVIGLPESIETIPPLPKKETNDSLAEVDDCGQHWSDWTALGRKVQDPCPEGCQKSQLLETIKQAQGFPPKPKIRHKYQCVP